MMTERTHQRLVVGTLRIPILMVANMDNPTLLDTYRKFMKCRRRGILFALNADRVTLRRDTAIAVVAVEMQVRRLKPRGNDCA